MPSYININDFNMFHIDYYLAVFFSLASAINESQYLIAKELFTDNSELNEVLLNNDVLKLCISDDGKIDYDEKNVNKCENFLFFQKILSQKGINGSGAISSVIKSKRRYYIEYMIDNNGKFGWYFAS